MQAYRAPSLLQPHRARQAFADAHNGKIAPLFGFYCGFAGPTVSRVVAQLGFDLVWIDWEHTAMGVETMTQMVHDIQLISEGKTAALVRVPGHDHAAIGYALDAGASIVVPQVETVEQAKHVISAARFGSRHNGTRSAPPMRWLQGLSDTPVDGQRTLHENLNDQAAIIMQIESLDGINNLDAILTECAKDIDSIWLGMLDARVSMGLPGFLGEEPEWLEALDTFNAALKKHNQAISGLALGTPEAQLKMAEGRSVIFTSTDIWAVQGEMKTLYEAKERFPPKNYSTPNN